MASMKSLVTIKEYAAVDKDKVTRLLRLNTPEYFSADEENYFIDYLEFKKELYYVAVHNGDIVGCAGINFTDSRTAARLSWDIVHPDYHGQSVGTQLIKYRLDRLRSMNNIREITVRTSQFAYKFYEKHGFKLVEIIKDYWAKGFDLYNMKLN